MSHAPYPAPCRECMAQMQRRAEQCEGVDLLAGYCPDRFTMFHALVRSGQIIQWTTIEGPVSQARFEEARAALEAEKGRPAPGRTLQ